MEAAPKAATRRETEGLKAVADICTYVKQHGKIPSIRDERDDIRGLANRLNNLRGSRKGRNTVVFHESYQRFAEQQGLPGLFVVRDENMAAARQLFQVKRILDWMAAHRGRKPSHASNIPEARVLGNILHDMKAKKSGKTPGRIYAPTLAAVEASGHPGLLDVRKPTKK